MAGVVSIVAPVAFAGCFDRRDGFVDAFGFALAPFRRKGAKAWQLTMRWLPMGLDLKGRVDIVSIILVESGLAARYTLEHIEQAAARLESGELIGRVVLTRP